MQNNDAQPKSPKISVIVPVYKVEKYLPECIESVLAQTFTDFELILVDDGSPDNSGKICDDYAKKDSRIRVFHKENGGVSSARNLGLDNARGDWIGFVDSDDWLGKCYFTELYSQSNSKTSISVGSSVSVFSSKKILNQLKDERICTSELISFFSRKEEVCFWAPWAKIFKNPKFLNRSIRFKEGVHYAEDWIFLLEYLALIPGEIVFSSKASYFYRRYNESSSARYFGFENEIIFYRVGCEALERLIPRSRGWAWSWQTSMLLTRIFPCMDLSNRDQKEEFENVISDFFTFFMPKTSVQKVSKILLFFKFYKMQRVFTSSLSMLRHLRLNT